MGVGPQPLSPASDTGAVAAMTARDRCASATARTALATGPRAAGTLLAVAPGLRALRVSITMSAAAADGVLHSAWARTGAPDHLVRPAEALLRGRPSSGQLQALT